MGLGVVTDVVLVLVVVMLCVSSSPVQQEGVDTCDCKYCDEKVTTIDPTGEKEMTTIVPDEKANKKDNSGDGDETICARDRDFPDKTFPSVCHMLCHNQCTRYRGALLEKENTTRHLALAYRTNYYILWDGPCERKDHGEDR